MREKNTQKFAIFGSMIYTCVYALGKVGYGRDGTRTRISRLSTQGAMLVTLHAHVYANAYDAGRGNRTLKIGVLLTEGQSPPIPNRGCLPLHHTGV